MGRRRRLHKATPRKERNARALPEHLPRVERVIEPKSIVCPCGPKFALRASDCLTLVSQEITLERFPA